MKNSLITRKINQAGMFTGVLLATFLPASVFAQLVVPPNPDSQTLPSNIMVVFTRVANVMLALIGAVAVIMLIVGGFRYVASAGNSTAIEGAKNTILYAIIGIVVAFLAYAAVNFLVTRLTT